MNSQKYEWNTWQEIDWKTVEKSVFKLQKRIYRASQRGKVKLVHRLQRLLTHSYMGKLWATRRVTQDNTGKKTAGVDGLKFLRPSQRLDLAKNLKLNNKSRPTRRVWLTKPDGDKRPLGIPTMDERARQCLVKLALEPQWEARFEENSYGFRPGRSCHDAIQAIFKAINQKPKYVLDADIAKCFDRINHQKLLAKLETYPQLRKQVKAWLKSGVIDNDNWFPTEEGIPQGGVCSPLLANIALHGMELEIKKFAETIKTKNKASKKSKRMSISLIRYADDFVLLHEDLEAILKGKEIIEKWLNDIGLELKSSKTRITHTLKQYQGRTGFDFLGFNIRQYPKGKYRSGKSAKGHPLGYKTLIKPAKEKVIAHNRKLSEGIHRHNSGKQIDLIRELNPIIKGWSNYYSAVCSTKTYHYCDNVLYQQLKRWAIKKHPRKNKRWIQNKYWKSIENQNWVFTNRSGLGVIRLLNHQETSIVRHIKVQRNRSPFDGDWIYWSSRLGTYPETPKRVTILLKKQKGKCNYCGLSFKPGDLLEIDHITPKSIGGKDEYKNLQLLHRHCHDTKTAQEDSMTCTHEKGFCQREAV